MVATRRCHRTAVVASAIVCLVPLAGPAGAAVPSATAAQCADGAAVRVVGAVAKPLRLCRADLDRLGTRKVKASFDTHHKGRLSFQFAGPLLYDVVTAAKPKFRSAKGDRLRFSVTAVAGNGYAATVAWAEFDPALQNRRFVLATTQDGKPCEPARLVVTGDDRGDRYVSGVLTLRVTRN
ncbi:MAG: hypothetical protein ACT4QF_08575 [Sporichthyaceae bacterium]